MKPNNARQKPGRDDSARNLAQEPPHSDIAEQGVLGSILSNPAPEPTRAAWDKVVGTLAPEDFHRHDHQLIYRAMGMMFGQGAKVDAITLSVFLGKLGWLAESGGVSYLASLAKETPSAANIDAYADIVLDRSIRRQTMAGANDLLALAHDDGRDVLGILADAEGRFRDIAKRRKGAVPPLSGIDPEKLASAQLHPRCIVDKYLYANLDLIAAAGGTGKTTTLIYEAICTALGHSLWGLKVWNPGATLFITAEDTEEIFHARIREIMDAMGLNAYERQKVMSRITIWDVSGDIIRLAELGDNGNIQLTSLADDIVSAYRDSPPAVIVFDPCISFGPGERIINDGEQAIVTACRRIIRGLDCCVRIIHHTGKGNANATHQYASRGGTALPDGSRMVHVFSSANPKDRGDGDLPANKPEGFELGEGESGFIIHRAKLTYEAPQPNIWVKRRGYVFEHFTETPRTKGYDAEAREREMERDAETLFQCIRAELDAGRKHTGETLAAIASTALKMSRARMRAALARLISSRRVTDEELPVEERKGQRKTYFKPAAGFGGIDPETEPTNPPSNPAEINPAAIREWRDGGFDYPPLPPSNSEPAADGLAGFGGFGGIEDEGVPV